jgi:hypothetical protein
VSIDHGVVLVSLPPHQAEISVLVGSLSSEWSERSERKTDIYCRYARKRTSKINRAKKIDSLLLTISLLLVL